MPILLSNLFLRGRLEWVATNAQGGPVQKAKKRAAEETQPETPMSTSTYPLAGHSNQTLRRMEEFFRAYKPKPMDRAWAEARHAELKREIERRATEDKEGTR